MDACRMDEPSNKQSIGFRRQMSRSLTLFATGMMLLVGAGFDVMNSSAEEPGLHALSTQQGRGYRRRYRGGQQVQPQAPSTTPAAPETQEPAEPNLPPLAEAVPNGSVEPQPAADEETPDERFAEDRDLFHGLLSRHTEIKREVENLENGVRTVTEADDPELASLIRRHVARMKTRVEEPAPIHMRDPLFRALFGSYDKIEMTIEETEKGVRVTETSDDPYVVKLIQAHAAVVSLFVKNGHSEVRNNHELPEREATSDQ